MSRTHELDSEVVYYAWDNAIRPRLEIESGDTIVLRTRDSSDASGSAA
ncbi:MAG TPA: hypothetical protein VHG53_04195 [Candidatus Limnocylindria bacterium]|nr:hypothetical protein [Candidatus Limnocylindria bacterium]